MKKQPIILKYLSISFTNEEGIIRQLINNISEEDFKDQVEIIGWLYQYYNTELKDDVFKDLKKRVKISKERFQPLLNYSLLIGLLDIWLKTH